MTATIIDGNKLAAAYHETFRSEVTQLKQQGIQPGLTVVLVGNHPASLSYVKAKVKDCEKVGIASEVIRLSEDITEQELLKELEKLNHNEAVHGILVQLPLPDHINEKVILHAIAPEKDVDGFHPINVGNMMIGDQCYLPCTPHGIVRMVKDSGVEIAGKHVVVIGRSNIVGKPVSLLMLQENATVTICHSKTKDLAKIASEADILIAAIGRPQIITADYIKPGAVVIDVGVNRLDTGKLVGDVDYQNVLEKAGYITPVPGGVGPMTRTMLLYNTLQAAREQQSIVNA